MSSERQDHNEISPWWGEHVHRYQQALKYLSRNDRVLDLACGNGFGSKLLSDNTVNEVIGADISPETIQYCKETFNHIRHLQFEVVDGTKMQYPSGHFNVIISFETIEHTTKYNEMLAEFSRALANEGYAIISTPNIEVNSPGGKVLNPYHTQEFNYDELVGILERHFKNVEVFGQKYIRYQNPSIKNKIGKLLESLFYMRGVRKTPIAFQNAVMKMVIQKNMYPQPDDFEMTDDQNEIRKCKTFFAICRKEN